VSRVQSVRHHWETWSEHSIVPDSWRYRLVSAVLRNT
jgi:hypothetical protein